MSFTSTGHVLDIHCDEDWVFSLCPKHWRLQSGALSTDSGPPIKDWLAVILDPKICRQHPNNSQDQSQNMSKLGTAKLRGFPTAAMKICVKKRWHRLCSISARHGDVAVVASLMFLGVYDVEICWTVTGRFAPQSFRAGKAECLIPGICSDSFACESVSAKHLASWMWWGLEVWWVEKVQVSWLVIFVGILCCWLNMLNSGGYTQNWHGLSARNYLLHPRPSPWKPKERCWDHNSATSNSVERFSIIPHLVARPAQLGHGEPVQFSRRTSNRKNHSFHRFTPLFRHVYISIYQHSMLGP